MKQLLQNLNSGETYREESPAPIVSDNCLLIASSISLISVGTEKMLVDFGKSNYLQKAKQQPEKVKMVIDKIKTDGLFTTVDAVRSKLAQPIPLGYSNAGTVVSVGNNVVGYKVGDRVVSNGPHADIVKVPANLCAKIPDNVTDESAAFTVISSIGLQGIRLAKPTLGEAFVVTGVGLIGLLTVQLLRAHGCRVLAIDYDESKLELAKSFGAESCNPGKGENPVEKAHAFSRGRGIDAVIITASTKSSDPVSQAAQMCRKRGRIVLVGVTGLELNRSDFYEKEISFQVSCSYGPGRYDSEYEEKGNDYPFGLVRWTEQRNFEAVLDMMSAGIIDVQSLITKHFDFDDAVNAYHFLSTESSALGILLKYKSDASSRMITDVVLNSAPLYEASKPIVGFIGGGNYASRVLIPFFKSAGAQLHTIATAGGINAVVNGKKFGFLNATTDTQSMIDNSEINTLAVVTRHHSHAKFVGDGIRAGKNIFVEKPLAITREQLQSVKEAYNSAHNAGYSPRVMVGFNRRFAPQIRKMKELLDSQSEPKSFIMTMNAGSLPDVHWTQDTEVGGGRIIGEACHFIDLMRYLTGSEIVSIQALRMGDTPAVKITEDKATISLGFKDGSFGTIHYFSNGSSLFPKERIEVFVAGRVLQLDNFRKLTGYGWRGFSKFNLWKQDKGQKACADAFLRSISEGKSCPIPIDEIFEVAEYSIRAAELLREQ